jgi:hypothetical protein
LRAVKDRHRSSHGAKPLLSEQRPLERENERLSREVERLRQELIERDRKLSEAEKQIPRRQIGSRTEVGSAATELSYIIEATLIRRTGGRATPEGPETE